MAAPFDVILLGPTGVTGREVARYLARRAPQLGLTWAVAGRDRDRIDAVLGRVGATPDGVVVADVADVASIDALVERGRVVANLVGPYARYGEPVHRACARAGVHQLDLTGEIDWVGQMIDRHEPTARASGAAIIPCAGFESLPFDLAALLAAGTAHGRSGSPVAEVDAAVAFTAPGAMTGITDAVSGGTFASLVEIMRSGRGRLPDPHALDPVTSRRGGGYDLRPRRHTGTGAWLAPLFPSPLINPPVLHRSAALLRADGDATFAADYGYREGTVTTSMLGPANVPGVAPVASAAMALGQAAVTGAQLLPKVIRSGLAGALSRFGPQTGTGPRPETLDEWSYRIDVRAVTVSGDTADINVGALGLGYKSTAARRRSRLANRLHGGCRPAT
ncbi:MAG: saccharopine dehydrogenase NADP-binding domain-containing protein [Acidimicrobiales bacterium]